MAARRIGCLCWLLLCVPAAAGGWEDLSRGHRILLRKGLQIQGMAHPIVRGTGEEVGLDLDRWAESNFTSVNLNWNDMTENYVGPAPGIPWARLAVWTPNSQWALRPAEMPYLPSMVSFQYSDEDDISDPGILAGAATWLASARIKYPNVLTHLNQWGSQHTVAELQNFLVQAQPDMVMFDTYPFHGSGDPAGGSPTEFYEHMQKYRLLGLGGHDATGAQPIPYALWLQTSYGYPPVGTHSLSESEMRLNQFSAWAFGYTFTEAYVYTTLDSGGLSQSALFNGVGDSDPTPKFYQMAETNRQSRNLGDALVRLVSTDVRLLMGEHQVQWWAVDNVLPSGVSSWSPDADPYISSITADNLGSTNGGLEGDVIVGYFRPLFDSYDAPEYEDEIYFMIVNGLSDADAEAWRTKQLIHMDFDFQDSGITRLLRLSRDTGEVEPVELTYVGGSSYSLDLILDGGTGDLFKFDTGEDFLPVVPEPNIAGDLDGDGFVGQTDLNIVLGEWGNSAPLTDPRADNSGDGFVGQLDLSLILDWWGQGTPPTNPVPEPATLSLLALGSLGLLRRKPKSRSRCTSGSGLAIGGALPLKRRNLSAHAWAKCYVMAALLP